MSFLRYYVINPFFIILCKIRKNTIPLSTVIDGIGYMKGCHIGKYCFVGNNFNFNFTNIGNYTCIASNVQIGGMEHSIDELSISPRLYPEKCIGDAVTTIGHDVWICGHVIIRQGITIGDGAVIGANSFVNHDVEPYSIVAGNPAKLIRYRKAADKKNQIYASEFWEYPPQKAKEKLSNII